MNDEMFRDREWSRKILRVIVKMATLPKSRKFIQLLDREDPYDANQTKTTR
jgi:hypothetical protein